MRSLQQQKQLELNLGPVAEMPPSHRFEEFIASHLSESSTGQIRLMESILERNNMKRLKSVDCALSAMPMTVSSSLEASGREIE